MIKKTNSEWWQKDPMPRWWQKDYGRITRRELLIYAVFSFNIMFALTMPQFVRESLL
tara:strand:+ start:162 stop:332 length:171 start_codon:yes stop_codon:yes gene_type:complete